MIRFVPGKAWAAVAGSRVAVLPANTEPEQIDRTFSALSEGAPLHDIANAPALYGTPLVLGDFGLERRLARRSGVPARVDDNPLVTHENTQLEFEPVHGSMLLVGDISEPVEPLFKIECGVTRVRALQIQLSDVSLETLMPEDVPDLASEEPPSNEPDAPVEDSSSGTAPTGLSGGIIDSVPGFRSATGGSSAPSASTEAGQAVSGSAAIPPTFAGGYASAVSPPAAPSSVPAPVSQREEPPVAPPSAPAEQLGDHDGHTVRAEDAQELIARMRAQRSGSVAAEQQPDAAAQPAESASGPEVLSTICFVGHVNPPASTNCAVCGGAIAPGSLQRRPRPDVAAAVLPSGERIPLRTSVVFGRRPRPRNAGADVRLVIVESPQEDISRSHLELRAEDWNIVAEDLGSTNGTMLLRPGQQPQRLRPEVPAFVQPGDRLDVGEDVVIEVVAP